MADKNIIDQESEKINEAQNKAQNSINEYVDKTLPEKIDSIKAEILVSFVDEEGKQIPENELTEEQKNELQQKLEPEIKALYSEARDFIYDKTTKRLEDLNNCKDEIEKLKKELDQDIKNDRNNLKTMDPNSDEFKKLQEEIDEKETQFQRIPDLEKKYQAGFHSHQSVMDQGILGLKRDFKDYPYINVQEDKAIKGMLGDRQLGSALRDEVELDKGRLNEIDKMKDELSKLDPNSKEYKDLKEKIDKKEKQVKYINGRIKRNEGLLEYAPEKEIEDKENEKNEENKDEKQEEKLATAPKGGASIPADVAKAMQQMAGQQVVDSEEPVEHKAPSYADILGYDPSNALNYDSSMSILGVFMGSADSPMGTPITDDLRIELLNSPEGAKIVQQALMKINSQDELVKYNFLNRLGKKFNSSRMNKKVMAMIEKQLPAQLKEKADSISKEDKAKIQEELGMPGLDLNGDIESKLKEMNADQINLLGNKVDSLSGVYNEKISELKEILNNKDLSDEDRTRYKGQLDVINSKKMVLDNSIGNYVGVHKFQDIAKDATKGEINQNYMLNPKSTISDDMPKKTFAGQDKVYSESQKIERDVKEQEIVDKYNDLRMSGKKIPTELQEQFNNISYKDLETIKNNRNEGPTKE